MVASTVIAVLGATFFVSTRDQSDETTGENAARAFVGGRPTLVYADFADAQDLRRLELPRGPDRISLELPRSGNLIAAGGSSWLAIETSDEQSEGRTAPTVYLFDPTNERETSLGIALMPEWSPDGSKLAWSRPEDPIRCGTEGCRGPRTLVVSDPGSLDPSEVYGPATYDVLGWAGDHLILGDVTSGATPILRSISPQGVVTDLPLLPREFWAASPDGRYMVASGPGGTRFFEMEDGRLGAQLADIAIAPGTMLGAGAWSHDSTRVAAFAQGDDGYEMVVFSPSNPQPRVVTDGGEASTGQVLWSPDNDAFVFQRFTGRELEAVYCPIEPAGCDVSLSWTRGIALLRIE